jgi:hypothetical protein
MPAIALRNSPALGTGYDSKGRHRLVAGRPGAPHEVSLASHTEPAVRSKG